MLKQLLDPLRLAELGFITRFVRLMRQSFTPKPLNAFEIELRPIEDDLAALKLDALDGQKVLVERMAKTIDAVQCLNVRHLDIHKTTICAHTNA